MIYKRENILIIFAIKLQLYADTRRNLPFTCSGSDGHFVACNTGLRVITQPGHFDALGVRLPHITLHPLFWGSSNHPHSQPEYLKPIKYVTDTVIIHVLVKILKDLKFAQ